MAVYSTEPGVRVTRNDLGVRPTVSDPGTDTVLVIGLAVDGPNDTAVSIRSLEEATRIFGPTHKCTELGYDSRVKGFNGNTLVRTIREVWEGGARSVIARRVGGTNATASLKGYNMVTDELVTISTSGPVNLRYGNYPSSNVALSVNLATVQVVSGADLKMSSVVSLSTGYLGWTVYFPTREWESKITANDGTTLTLSGTIPSYVVADDPVVLYPGGTFAVFDANGHELNPANFIIGPGSDSVAATIALRPTLLTGDSRYINNYPSNGDIVMVQYLMQPDKVITLKSATPSDVYNARGSYGTATQDGCWVTLEQSLTTMATLQLFVPKFRGSPLTAGTTPIAAIKYALSAVGSYDDLVSGINTNTYNTCIRADLASDATWNSLPVTINGSTGGDLGLTYLAAGHTAVFMPVLSTLATAKFSGGATEMAMGQEALYNRLTGGGGERAIFDELVEVPAQYRIIGGVNAEDTVGGIPCGWLKILTKHCWEASVMGNGSSGIIGVRSQVNLSASTPADIVTRVAALTNPATGIGAVLYAGLSEVDVNSGATVDIGQYINIMAGPDALVADPNLNKLYVSSLAGHYTGLLASLGLNRSTTDSPIGGIRGVLYTYTRAQLDALALGVGTEDGARGGAYTCIKYDTMRGRGWIVYSGETAAKRDSQFTKEGILKTTQTAEFLVARAARQFLGLANTLSTHQAMQHACEQALEKLAESGALAGSKGVGYEIQVSVLGNDTDVGRARIDMIIRTAVELRVIVLNVTVQR